MCRTSDHEQSACMQSDRVGMNIIIYFYNSLYTFNIIDNNYEILTIY